MTIAIISTGGHQYKVQENQELQVNQLALKKGEKFILDDKISAKKVEAEILNHLKGQKIKITKFRPKTRYKKTVGYRGRYSKIKILKIK